jgi:hypothetical protein
VVGALVPFIFIRGLQQGIPMGNFDRSDHLLGEHLIDNVQESSDIAIGGEMVADGEVAGLGGAGQITLASDAMCPSADFGR